MKTKFLGVLAIVISSAFFISSCTIKDQVKINVIQKINTPTQPELRESQLTPTSTDDQLLNDLQKDDSTNIDQEFTKLEQELN